MISLELIALLFIGTSFGIIGIVLTELDKRTNGK
jgi:hypothetical protein